MESVIRPSLLSALLALINIATFGQTSSQNYIKTFDVQVSGVISPANLTINTPVATAIQSIQYYDGLGRPVQAVQKGTTPAGMDLITPVEYNSAGLDENHYEPYVKKNQSSSDYDGDYKTNLEKFYSLEMGFDIYGKSPTDYEKSPLNRVLKQGAPGGPWQLGSGDHYKELSYLSNTSSGTLSAILWKVEGSVCIKGGNYQPNELYITKTIDEGGSESYEFKDKLGQVVLKRQVLDNGTTLASTYYVYDDFGLLRFVISPEGAIQITGDFDAGSDLAKKYVYCYTYDGRRRLVEKQVPGKDVEYYVYNKNDKVVMYSDGNLRQYPARWLFTKYDALGRVIMTGIRYGYTSRITTQTEADNYEVCWEYVKGGTTYPVTNYNYYSNLAYPINDGNVLSMLTLNYYDTYDVYTGYPGNVTKNRITYNASLDYTVASLPLTLESPKSDYIAGMPSVSITDYNGIQLPAATYYDIRNRAIQTRAMNHTRGYDHFTTQYYNLTDKIDILYHQHSAIFGSSTYNRTELTDNGYDDAGRLTSTEYTYNGSTPHQLTYYTYDELGRMRTKRLVTGTTTTQTIDYTYNIRGWLTAINNPNNVSDVGDLFGMELYYNTVNSDIGNTQMYNGNISAVMWQNTGALSTVGNPVNGLKAYKFTYDKLNRLNTAIYTEIVSNVWQNSNKYGENIGQYDLNGNIIRLTRMGLRAPNNSINTIDDLTYTYDGNRLKSVNDAVTVNNTGDFYDNGSIATEEYFYDYNGNLKQDLNKQITLITYNVQNLPASVQWGSSKKIDYQYDAAGNKMRQLYTVSGTLNKSTDFVSNFVYENGAPAWVNFAEGRIVYNTNGTWFAENNIKDHLGNVRVAYYLNNGVVTTRQIDSYYPFGMNIKGLTVNRLSAVRPNEYLYNGKMFQDEGGLNWLDYGARFYDPQLGRWHTVDQKAENAPSWTPYRFGFNNPIRYFDPDGQWEWDANGNLVAQKGDQSYSLAKFLGTSQKNAMTMLNRSGVTANDKGILNLKVRQQLSKDNLWVGTKSGSGPVVNDTKEATAHYFNGNGQAADVGNQSTRELLSSDKFQEEHTKITTQKVQAEGSFSVDLTDETFHIGRTNVDYSVGGNGKSSSVTYTLFSRDGFWDPNFVAEKTLGKVFNRYKPDGMGPNLEQPGGTPYPYKTRERTFFFKPVEE